MMCCSKLRYGINSRIEGKFAKTVIMQTTQMSSQQVIMELDTADQADINLQKCALTR